MVQVYTIASFCCTYAVQRYAADAGQIVADGDAVLFRRIQVFDLFCDVGIVVLFQRIAECGTLVCSSNQSVHHSQIILLCIEDGKNIHCLPFFID